MSKKKNSAADYIVLYGAFIVYSLCGLFSKLASSYELLSLPFLGYYACSIFVLAIYAFLWQKVLKRFALNVAFANKPAATVLTMLWGIVFFREKISWNMILGIVIVVAGMLLAGAEDE